MGDIQKYYENTENALPHPMVKKFIKRKTQEKLYLGKYRIREK